MAQIQFHNQDVPLPHLDLNHLAHWLVTIAKTEEVQIKKINYIFCSDQYLLQINQDYLQHDYYTDIITFDLSETEQIVSDIYISTDRVKDNAIQLNTNLTEETLRVIAHGLLHLIGYNDKTQEQASIMRKKEEACISLWLKTTVPRGTV